MQGEKFVWIQGISTFLVIWVPLIAAIVFYVIACRKMTALSAIEKIGMGFVFAFAYVGLVICMYFLVFGAGHWMGLPL
jgi:hypothetical protein